MIPPRRKKWTEAEEKTLIDKYGEMVTDGSLPKQEAAAHVSVSTYAQLYCLMILNRKKEKHISVKQINSHLILQ